MDATQKELDQWSVGADRLPGRVQVPWTPLSLSWMDYELPFSLFGAE